MEPFDYIQSLAKEYQEYAENEELLLKKLNSLPEEVYEEIYETYKAHSSQPVNILRAEIAVQVLKHHSVDRAFIEETKNKINQREVDSLSFTPTIDEERLRNYAPFEKNLFSSYKTYWNLLYVFFYRAETKKTVRSCLLQMAKQLLLQSGLKDYTFKNSVYGFEGFRDYGDTQCSFALYPDEFQGRQADCFRFVVTIGAEATAGIHLGSNINIPFKDELFPVFSFEDVLLQM